MSGAREVWFNPRCVQRIPVGWLGKMEPEAMFGAFLCRMKNDYSRSRHLYANEGPGEKHLLYNLSLP